jgi:hypothetical protein
VRLARLEACERAEQAARDAEKHFRAGTPPEGATTVVIHRTQLEQTAKSLKEQCERATKFYPWLEPEFSEAARETSAIDLLFHRRLSQIASGYGRTAAAPVAERLLVSAFEEDLKRSRDELVAENGWYDRRWEVFPKVEKGEEGKILIPGWKETPLVLQDPIGPRHLTMKDESTRASDGLLVRADFEPEKTKPEVSHWRFHLLPGSGASTYLRVSPVAIGLYRSELAPGKADSLIKSVALPPGRPEEKYRAFLLIPGEGFLHIFVDGKLVLNLEAKDAAIPQKLRFTVFPGKLLLRSVQARGGLPAEGRKEK